MQTEKTIDLRSDTVTRPTAAMRAAMAAAEVGDDVLGEDPTVNALQAYAAALCGKEAALFVPTGTMANLLAALTQTRPGDTIILASDAHPYNYESGNLAMVAGLMPRTIPAQYGILSPEQVAEAIVQTDDHHFSQTTLVSIENTSNRGGGAIYPLETVDSIGAITRARGLRLHCDGARIFNACIATGVTVAEYAAPVDTLSFCLSKGLGAPVGSLLVGDTATIDVAHRYRKMLGGGMRQAGVLAAAGLYALENHVDRLRDDHANAELFRSILEGVRGLSFPFPSPTSMVYVDVDDAVAVATRLAAFGVLVGATSPTRIRAVFHLDVCQGDAENAAAAFARAVRECG